MKINKKSKNDLNKIFTILCKDYHKSIPLQDISNYLQCYNLEMLQEDNTPFQGFVCGKEGRTSFLIGYLKLNTTNEYITIKDSILSLSWYKMESGRYEIVCYLS
jgi:hypothetical protein